MDKSLVGTIPIEEQDHRKWRVVINGHPVEPVHRMTLTSEFGRVVYGWKPEGYDGWSFHEVGSGGAVALPWTLVDGEVFVGLVRQLRHNQGGVVWNAPRGFGAEGEDLSLTAQKELVEETGLRVPLEQLTEWGEPANPNSAFWVTAGQGKGVRFFGLQVDPGLLVRRDEGYGLEGLEPTSAEEEGIGELRFLHWTRAANVGDMFTNSAVARLMAWLATTRRSRAAKAADQGPGCAAEEHVIEGSRGRIP